MDIFDRQDRRITVSRDAIGNVIVSGDNNQVHLTLYVADQRLLPSFQATPLAADPLSNPYRGLDAFQEDDADKFFGRSKLVRRAWVMFRQLQSGVAPRILAVVGPSGSGKSSLVRAGLIPELAREPMEGLRNPKILILRPGREPLKRLAEVLKQLAPDTDIQAATLGKPSAGGHFDALHQALAAATQGGAAPTLIFIDQFEELYTACDDANARSAFLAQLTFAVSHPDMRTSVVLTIRSDFVGAVRDTAAFATAIRENRLQLRAMDADELEEAIARPAINFGHPWPPILIQSLVAQAEGRAGALPLLQFALKRLWPDLAANKLDDNRWSSRLIEDFLVQAADALYENAATIGNGPSHGQRVIRRALLCMVQLGEGTEDTRRVARLSEIVAEGEDPHFIQHVLAQFSAPETRLITASEIDGEPVYELTHESLIASWDRLRDWLGDVADTEQRERLRADHRLQRRLAIAAREWKAKRGGLWRPPELDLLTAYIARQSPELTTVERTFTNTAIRQAARERKVRRFGIASLLILFVAAVAGMLFAFNQSRIANTERANAGIAFARSLTSGGNAVAALKVLRERLADSRADTQLEGDLVTALYAALSNVHLLGAIRVDGVKFATWDAKTGEILLQRDKEIQRYDGALALITTTPITTKPIPTGKRADSDEQQPALIPIVTQTISTEGEDQNVYKMLSPFSKHSVQKQEWGETSLRDESGRIITVFDDSASMGSISEDAYRFSPDGKTLFVSHRGSVNENEAPELLDITTGKRKFSLETGQQKIMISAFDPAGERLLTVSEQGVVAVWATGPNIFSSNEQSQLNILDKEADLASVTRHGETMIVRASTGKLLFRTRAVAHATSDQDDLGRMELSSDGKWMWIQVDSKTAELWSLSSFRLQRRVAMPAPDADLSFSPTARFAIISSDEKTWLFATGPTSATLPVELSAVGRELSFDPTETVVMASSIREGVLNVWRTDTGTMVQGIRLNSRRALAEDSTGKVMAVAAPDVPTPVYVISISSCFAVISSIKTYMADCSRELVGQTKRGGITLLVVVQGNKLELINPITGTMLSSYALPTNHRKISQFPGTSILEIATGILTKKKTVNDIEYQNLTLFDLDRWTATEVKAPCTEFATPKRCNNQVLLSEGPLAGQLITLEEPLRASAYQQSRKLTWFVTESGSVLTVGPDRTVKSIGKINAGDLTAFKANKLHDGEFAENESGTFMVCFHGPCIIAPRNVNDMQVLPQAHCETPAATPSDSLFYCAVTPDNDDEARAHLFVPINKKWTAIAAIPRLVEESHIAPWSLTLASDPNACATVAIRFANLNADDARDGYELWYLPANRAVMQLKNDVWLTKDRKNRRFFLDKPFFSINNNGEQLSLPHVGVPAICNRTDAIRLIDDLLKATSLGLLPLAD